MGRSNFVSKKLGIKNSEVSFTLIFALARLFLSPFYELSKLFDDDAGVFREVVEGEFCLVGLWRTKDRHTDQVAKMPGGFLETL